MKRRAILSTVFLLLVAVSFSRADINKKDFNKERIPGLVPLSPTILKIFQQPSVNLQYTHSLILSGNFFGNAPGSREVRMNHFSLSSTQSDWSMKQIVAWIPSDVPAGKRYPICIWDKAANKAVSNSVDFLVMIKFYNPPAQGAANSKLTLYDFRQNLGSQRKVKVGKIGINAVEAEILQWDAHSITIQVPPLDPGKYQYWIEDNGEIVSYNFEFTIL